MRHPEHIELLGHIELGAYALKNLTIGSPTKLLLTFTAPLLIGSLMQQAYQITDAAVVGRVLGVNGLAAIGAVGALIFLLIGFAWGSTAGLAIPVSKAFGADDLPQTRRMIAAGTYTALAISVVITAVGLVFGPQLLVLLGTPAHLLPDASAYLQITAGGAVLTVALSYLSAVVRGVGDAKTPLFFGVGAGALNAILVVVFVAFLHLGIPGAAATTVIAQAVTVAVALGYLARRMPQLVPNRAEWRAGWHDIAVPARTGVPMGLQTCAIALGVVVLQSAVNTLGSDAMAAYAAVGRIEGIIIAPLHAFNIAVVTFVAQNRGAEQWLRVRHSVTRAAFVVGSMALAMGAVQFALARPMVRVFLHAGAGAPVDLAVTYLRITAGLFALLGLKFVFRGAVQGMGASAVPTASTVLELVVRASVAFWLVNRFGLTGIALASPLAWMAGFGLNFASWQRWRRELLRRARSKTDIETEVAQPVGELPDLALAGP